MSRPGHSIRLRSSARSDRGRVRQNNEDSVHLWAESHNVLAVVADGMGGAVAGEEASRIAVETIQERLADNHHREPNAYAHYDPDELGDLLGSVVLEANSNIYNRSLIKPELKGMGTTVTMAFARKNSVVLAHVGDSRAYYVNGATQSIEQLTADHTFVQALLDAGHISPEEADHHPMRNVLYRALGQSEDLDVDVQYDVEVFASDRLVLCSDGLTLHVNTDEILKLALASNDPNEISDNLVNLANSRGGQDNVSVIVIVVDEDEKLATSEMVAVADDTFDEGFEGDDGATIPMNPEFLNMTRLDRNKPQSSRSNYGEGRDTLEPYQ